MHNKRDIQYCEPVYVQENCALPTDAPITPYSEALVNFGTKIIRENTCAILPGNLDIVAAQNRSEVLIFLH